MKRIWPGVVLLGALLFVGYTPAAAQHLSFSLPLDCESAPSCLLQNYVDLDPGPERRDPFCGTATYDGHNGTDIRVRNIPELNTGVPVLAMADGTVLRVRDGEPDRMIEKQADRDVVKGKQCGNGIVIDHGDSWTTQTCHLKQGSLTVQSGDEIARGAPIAQMGLSGDTAFPHVHVTVRKDNTVIDPISGKPVGASCDDGPGETLLTLQAARTLAARDSLLIDAGFSNGSVTGLQLRKGEAPKAVTDGSVVFYAQFKNLLKGDRISIDLHERGTSCSDRQPHDGAARPGQVNLCHLCRPPFNGLRA